MLAEAEKMLKKYFGYPSFREGQAKIIGSILEKNDIFAIMPTGAGKSICYQIPALIFSGMTLVISPLISLMKDQVDSLKELGIEASFINSSLTKREVNLRMDDAGSGKYRILYVAPERLDSEEFIDIVQNLDITLLAVDEAHCVSQWGHDFRKSYRTIPKFIKRLPNRPIVAAFTATATEEVKEDIIKLLELDQPQIYITGFDRPNLKYSVLRGQNKEHFLLDYLATHPSESGIIYAATRKEVDKLYELLKREGCRVGKYHAGLSDKEREQVQEAFVFDNLQLMIATNAFGMGIDKSNVRFVIHYNLPKNMESYYQEAGRAGRDGEPGECILLFSPQDIIIQKFLIEQSVYSPVRKNNEYKKLQMMSDYAHTPNCLRKFILEYFGEDNVDESCGNCGNCCEETEEVDVTVEAQKVISCIVRMREQYGATTIAEVLKGAKTKKVAQQRFNQLPTYGIMHNYSTTEIRDLINVLIVENFLQLTGGQYPVVKLLPKAREVLKGKMPVSQKRVLQKEIAVLDDSLFEHLRRLRKQIADREGVPPYIIFQDATLRELCHKLPTDLRQFALIKGVGESKLQKYGLEFIQAIAAGRSVSTNPSSPNSIEDQIAVGAEPSKTPSHILTLRRFEAGEPIEKIAQERDLTLRTIQDHLLRCHREGVIIEWERLISPDAETMVLEKIAELATVRLKPLKEALPEEIDYFIIQAVIAKYQKCEEVSI